MASKVTLRRPARSGPLISLVPMIDVMLILLVFFMVTSTYLNLDMIPTVRQQDNNTATRAGAGEGNTVMIRLAADGIPVVRGQALTPEALSQLLRSEMDQSALTRVLVLPSGAATTQALISVMDIATRAGVQRLRVIRLEARP
ncbi:MAG: ExbD/TolR family protein [Arenibacterium sp.]